MSSLLYLISWDIHPSIHPSIHLVAHSLFNMPMASEIHSLRSWEIATKTFYTIHPSIHPSIHLFGHPLLNMSMAPFNNPRDQSASKPVHF
jgi:hypothetical protein